MAYITIVNLNNKFGSDNIRIWSNLNNLDEDVDMDRVNQAITYADAYVNVRMNNGRYVVPLSGTPVAMQMVTEWSSIKAGEWLYESRGTRDGSPNADFENRIQALVRRVDEQIDSVLAGKWEPGFLGNWPTPTSPAVSYGIGYFDRRWPGQW